MRVPTFALCSLILAGPVLAQGKTRAFAEPVVLQGSLGEDRIEMQLRPKTEFEGGVKGSYFAFGHSPVILLAGEVSQDQVYMEESVNGKDVSGDWVGSLRDGLFVGEWEGLDGERKAFRLQVQPIRPQQTGAEE